MLVPIIRYTIRKKPVEMQGTECQKPYEYKTQDGCVGCQKTCSQDPIEYVLRNFSVLSVKYSLWEIFLNSFTFGEICKSRTGIFWSNKFSMNFWIYFIWTILKFYIKADIFLHFTRRNCILIYFYSESRPSNNLLKSYARIDTFSNDTNALFHVKGNKMRALKFSKANPCWRCFC